MSQDIGIPRTHVIVLIQDLNVRVVHATTGEVLTELKVDPTRDYLPKKQKNPEPLRVQEFPMSCEITTVGLTVCGCRT